MIDHSSRERVRIILFRVESPACRLLFALVVAVVVAVVVVVGVLFLEVRVELWYGTVRYDCRTLVLL